MQDKNGILVSIIIVTWNRKEDLNKTLLKLKSLPAKKVEIIVVDNNSNDGTSDLVKNAFSDVKLVVLSKNVGHAIGINEGFKIAKGKYLLLLDDDSYIKEKDLEDMVGKFESEPNLGVLAFNIIDLRSMKSQWQNLNLSIVKPNSDGSYPFFTFLGCGAGLKKEAFVKAGFFKRDFFMSEEEIELTTRMLIEGYDARYYPHFYVYHEVSPRRGKGGMLGSRINYNVRNSIWFIWKYFPFFKAANLTIGYLLVLLIQSFRAGVPNLWLKGLIDGVVQNPCDIKRNIVPKEIQHYYKPYFQEYSFTGRLHKELRKVFKKIIK